ncbi:MAG: thioredoxin family protein [Bacteroidota bacterium]
MRRTFVVVTGVLAVIGILFMNASSDVGGYEVGDYATDFELKNVNGDMVSLADYADAKGFIVVFTCNTCPYAKMYEKRIIDLDKKYKSEGFPVIAINPNDVTQQPGDSMDEMKARSASKGYGFPYLRDDEQKITAAYGATKTPHVFVLNKEASSKYKVEYIGAIDDSPRDASDVSEAYVAKAVDALLNGTKPEVTGKRAIGCMIKWRQS